MKHKRPHHKKHHNPKHPKSASGFGKKSRVCITAQKVTARAGKRRSKSSSSIIPAGAASLIVKPFDKVSNFGGKLVQPFASFFPKTILG